MYLRVFKCYIKNVLWAYIYENKELLNTFTLRNEQFIQFYQLVKPRPINFVFKEFRQGGRKILLDGDVMYYRIIPHPDDFPGFA